MLLLSVEAMRQESLTFDEPLDLTTGYSFWLGDYRLQEDSGALPQRWFALPLLVSKPNFPSREDAQWRQPGSLAQVPIDKFMFGWGNPDGANGVLGQANGPGHGLGGRVGGLLLGGASVWGYGRPRGLLLLRPGPNDARPWPSDDIGCNRRPVLFDERWLFLEFAAAVHLLASGGKHCMLRFVAGLKDVRGAGHPYGYHNAGLEDCAGAAVAGA